MIKNKVEATVETVIVGVVEEEMEVVVMVVAMLPNIPARCSRCETRDEEFPSPAKVWLAVLCCAVFLLARRRCGGGGGVYL